MSARFAHWVILFLTILLSSIAQSRNPAVASQVKACPKQFIAIWKSDREKAYKQIPEKICRMQIDRAAYICNTNTCNIDQTQTANWVEVTKGVVACTELNGGSADVKQEMLSLYGNPPLDGKLPEDCATLKLGQTYMLDDAQSEQDTHIAVKMWILNCWAQCSPYMSAVYGPSRNLVGAYLRPIKPPK